ncbi:MAG: alkaline phosphatase family protein [Phycisphaerae bacterium]|nr:alkaline phosphatase family protein [Phycisphaerae bacterium]
MSTRTAALSTLIVTGCMLISNVASAVQPKLVVLIVVDQLRGDLVTRFEEDFSQDGFRRLQNHGALFVNARYTYGSSETAPGHASVGTGRLPRYHGIVANKWFPEDAGPNGIHAVNDPQTRPVPMHSQTTTPGASPWRLIGPGLGDQIKLSDRRSRVFSVALKDRAAIFMAGKRPDAAFWWDLSTGQFISSTWYCDSLPEYVTAFNADRPADRWFGRKWELLLPEANYAGCHPFDSDWMSHPAFGSTFPHALPTFNPDKPRDYYSALWCTPFGNELVIDLAERILTNEKLGRGSAVDMLCIGLSSNDLVGHYFGPDSLETKDVTVQTDRQLARLLKSLDEVVGLDRCLIALTGDHGATSTPLLTQKLGLGGGIFDIPTVEARLNDQLQSFFPTPGFGNPPHQIVISLDMPWCYLNRQLMATLSEPDRQRAMQKAVEILKEYDGVSEVYLESDLSGPMPSRDEQFRYLAWRCCKPGRSGDIFVQLAPFWYKTDDKISGHDSGTNQDRHVPIYLLGPRIRPGRYFTEADPCDIASTLAALLGIEAPLNATGRVLHEAIDTRPVLGPTD